MSRGINKFIGIGNACADPDARTMPNGTAVTNLTIACGDEYKDKQTGNMVDKTEFVRLVFFGRLGEVAAQYIHKGSKIYVEGRLQTRSWEQDGIKRYTTEIVANEMQMLDSRSETGNTQKPNNQNSQAGNSQSSTDSSFDNYDDDIPF